MKTLLILAAMLMASCVNRPSITTVHPDGSISRTTLGGLTLAEADEVVAELEAPGPIHLRYAAKREDATRVTMAWVQALGAKWLAAISGHSQDLKTTTDGNVAVEGLKADVAKHQIDAGVTAGDQANEALKITHP